MPSQASKATLVSSVVAAQPAVSSRISRRGFSGLGGVAGPARLGWPGSPPAMRETACEAIHKSASVPVMKPTWTRLGAEGNPPSELIAP